MEARKKGKMDRNKWSIEPLYFYEEDLTMGIEEIDADEAMLITQLPPYIPLRKSTTKITKDPDSTKFMVSTPFLVENVPFEGNLLAIILYLNMED